MALGKFVVLVMKVRNIPLGCYIGFLRESRGTSDSLSFHQKHQTSNFLEALTYVRSLAITERYSTWELEGLVGAKIKYAASRIDIHFLDGSND